MLNQAAQYCEGTERAYAYLWSVAMTTESVREIIAWVGLLLILSAVGCATQPKVTKVLYEDRSAWIRLEVNPDADRGASAVPSDSTLVPSSSRLTALLEGFAAEKDYNAGLISAAIGKKYYNQTFVPAELAVLAPQLARGLAMASPGERVAYCLTADWSADERFITTGWAYIKKSYLHFKLVEWRTPVRVKSPAAPTSEACLVKPIPGYKTSDRFFQLDYTPKSLIVTHGPLGRSIYNGAGEVEFKLVEVAAFKPALPEGPAASGTEGTSRDSDSAPAATRPVAAAPRDIEGSNTAPAQKAINRKKAPKTP